MEYYLYDEDAMYAMINPMCSPVCTCNAPGALNCSFGCINCPSLMQPCPGGLTICPVNCGAAGSLHVD